MASHFACVRLRLPQSLLSVSLAVWVGGCATSPSALQSAEKVPPAVGMPGAAHPANAWSQLADMPTARLEASAAAVGTKIYVVGGHDASGPLSSNEIYDTVTNTWTTGKPMPTARWTLGVAALKGRVYAIGGNTGTVTQTNAVEAYDPTHNKWSTKASLPSAEDSL